MRKATTLNKWDLRYEEIKKFGRPDPDGRLQKPMAMDVNYKANLLKERSALLDYLLAKFHNEDWHGVQDAASDLRDIDSELKVFTLYEKRFLEQAQCNA